jgi:hypothetical protein
MLKKNVQGPLAPALKKRRPKMTPHMEMGLGPLGNPPTKK